MRCFLRQAAIHQALTSGLSQRSGANERPGKPPHHTSSMKVPQRSRTAGSELKSRICANLEGPYHCQNVHIHSPRTSIESQLFVECCSSCHSTIGAGSRFRHLGSARLCPLQTVREAPLQTQSNWSAFWPGKLNSDAMVKAGLPFGMPNVHSSERSSCFLEAMR